MGEKICKTLGGKIGQKIGWEKWAKNRAEKLGKKLGGRIGQKIGQKNWVNFENIL